MISDKAAKLIEQALQAAVDFERVMADDAKKYVTLSTYHEVHREASDNLRKTQNGLEKYIAELERQAHK